mmetsp:Transcript_25493/g.72622  ORF Transcript_25493/g.72622 Transcript_25493/m.72622 type:complete len:231 (+) Transcript_25493:266-958(+)
MYAQRQTSAPSAMESWQRRSVTSRLRTAMGGGRAQRRETPAHTRPARDRPSSEDQVPQRLALLGPNELEQFRGLAVLAQRVALQPEMPQRRQLRDEVGQPRGALNVDPVVVELQALQATTVHQHLGEGVHLVVSPIGAVIDQARRLHELREDLGIDLWHLVVVLLVEEERQVPLAQVTPALLQLPRERVRKQRRAEPGSLGLHEENDGVRPLLRVWVQGAEGPSVPVSAF